MLNSYISISKNKLFVRSAISVLFLIIILHLMFFENFSRKVLKNDLSTKIFHYIQNEGERIKVSAIGTSHTGDSLRMNEDYFFNYARSSTWYPDVAYAKVSHLLKYAPNLKVLFLEVDHISILGYDHTIHTPRPQKYLYLLNHVSHTLYDEKKSNLDDEQSPFFVSLQTDVAPVIHRKFFQSYLMGRGKKKEEVSPWETLTAKERIKSAKKRTRNYRIDTPSNIDKAVRDYYSRAILRAKEQGVKVYLIFNPQTKEYLAEIIEENNQRVDYFVSTLAREMNVTVLDYRHYFESDESFFENQDHLNTKGAEVFSREVMRVIENDL